MLTTAQIIVLATIVIAIIAIVIIIVNNVHKSGIKKEIDDLSVRFNAIKSIPLAFKLNKAQAMAKRNDDTSEKIQSYYNRYTEAQKHIDEISELLEQVEDEISSRKNKQVKTTIGIINVLIGDCEEEVKKIDEFLEQFSKKESEQRSVSAKLKEDYRDIKMAINADSNLLAIAFDGVNKKLEKIEELFSQSEEWMYANDYEKAKEAMNEIEEKMNDVKKCHEVIPDLVKDAKGVIPILFDEINRKYDLCKQRRMYLDHLDVDARISKYQTTLNECTKKLIDGEQKGVKQSLEDLKNELNSLLSSLDDESKDYTDAKTLYDNINSNIINIKNLYTYVEGSYSSNNDRFNMGDIGDYLRQVKIEIDNYGSDSIRLSSDLESNLRPSSSIKNELDALFKKTEEDLEKLTNYKKGIDKNTSDEERARTQLIKLQVVLNEVEVKVLEYHLPTIASTYKEDLKHGRERISKIKSLLEEIPLNIDKLNETLDEAIEYIYTFYNHVNNVVGMAIILENAVVFGNKYRSTYPAVDRDLSKAEFSYLNGEYTKAVTMAISCMETLFPNSANEKILEND